MNIGVIGWWNYDNQGDLAMLAALRQGLAPHHVVAIDTGFPANPDTIGRLNWLDFVILGGGTLIPGRPTAPFDTFDQWADQLQCPLGIAGLGVDPVRERYWPAVEALLERARFFYVRDRASRTLLREHPKVQVAPDLTFAYPLEVVGRLPAGAKTEPICGVNLRHSGTTAFDPTPWADALRRLPARLRGIPFSSFGQFGESAFLRRLDPNCPDRFDPALYRQIDIMVGAAFHSVLFAVQAATPVIAIDYAPKVRHFMVDNGLDRYLLGQDEQDRLPGLVAEVLATRLAITADLQALRTKLHEEAQQTMHRIRSQIERDGLRRTHDIRRVTVIVMGSGDDAKDRRTLSTCASQTSSHVETILIGAGPRAEVNAGLQKAAEESGTEYLTWIEGGDWFADDALDCLVSRLEQDPGTDVVYADYYAMNSANLPEGHHTVPSSDKLYRRDVIGPCFLMRRSLLSRTGWPPPDSPLTAYELWLRAGSTARFLPFHAPIFYSGRPINSPGFIALERATRRRWRRSRPVWARAAWRIVDSDLGERLFVKPLSRALQLLWRERHA